MSTVKPNYQEILTQELELRTSRNSNYSLRAFARDLNISISSLSRVMMGKQGLSVQKARAIAETLQLSTLEKSYFLALVESHHSRSKLLREHALEQVKLHTTQISEITMEYFKLLSDWYCYPILELTTVDGFESDANWISQRLGIPIAAVETTIERLKKVGLLQIDDHGKWTRVNGWISSPTGVPSRVGKSLHQQFFKKAETALFEQPVSEREFSTTTFSMHSEDLDWAKEELKIFKTKLVERLYARKDKNRLYQLSIQLFSLDQTTGKAIEDASKGEGAA